jgi:hypothetical protein
MPGCVSYLRIMFLVLLLFAKIHISVVGILFGNYLVSSVNQGGPIMQDIFGVD